MKRLLLIASLIAGLSGCESLPPVQMRAAPPPSAQDLKALIAIQSRDLDVDAAAVFPRVLTVLLNNGYLIRSASKELGQVSFYQQWNDPSQAGANITQEGTAIFTPAGPHKTQVRVVMTGGWQRLEVTGGGPRSTDSGMVGGVQMSMPPAAYRQILDQIENGLRGD